MKAIFVAVALLVAGAFATDVYDQFIDWTIQYNKVYNSAQEHVSRYNAFKSNLALVRHLNRQGKATFSLNKFADLTQEEFAAKYLRAMPVGQMSRRETLAYDITDYPASKNWVDDGAVTPIKDQKNCGSCWAFSATGNMEGAYFLAHKELPVISEQQLVDCEQDCMIFPGTTQQVCDEGCNGGLMPNAFTYAIREGMESEEDYPYKGVDQTCKVDKSKIKYHFTKWSWVDDNEDAMVAGLNENGPLSVALDATYWSFYSGGIYDNSCSSTTMNHGVLLVGYGEDSGKQYWIIKNSWGTSWGEKGYLRLIRGKNKCGVNNFVCTIIA